MRGQVVGDGVCKVKSGAVYKRTCRTVRSLDFF